jgi:hypothetical protein
VASRGPPNCWFVLAELCSGPQPAHAPPAGWRLLCTDRPLSVAALRRRGKHDIAFGSDHLLLRNSQRVVAVPYSAIQHVAVGPDTASIDDSPYERGAQQRDRAGVQITIKKFPTGHSHGRLRTLFEGAAACGAQSKRTVDRSRRTVGPSRTDLGAGAEGAQGQELCRAGAAQVSKAKKGAPVVCGCACSQRDAGGTAGGGVAKHWRTARNPWQAGTAAKLLRVCWACSVEERDPL